MTSNIGVNKRVVFNYLVAGSKCLSRDKAFNLPISNKDNKHHHSFWLPPELRTQITDCLKTLESSYTKQSAKLILKKELKSLINQILEEGIHPKDRRPGVTHLKRIMELNDFDFRDVTVSKLLESAYMYGVAAHMPGELRDMLAQPNLPASAIRLRLYSQAPRAKPHSPNIGIKNPTPADVFLTKDTEWQNLRVKYLRDTDSVSEDFWLDNMETAMNCLAFMTQSDLSEDQKTKKIGETLYGKSGIYQNSWWAWVVQFLYAEGRRKQWIPATYRSYLLLLLPPELITITSIVDVEEFDQDDLLALIDSLEQQNKAETQLKNQINLICRMISFAKLHQPEYSFPEADSLSNQRFATLNKRAHILSPGELESLIKQTYAEGAITEALVLTLVGFIGLRPYEVVYLRKKDITSLFQFVELNIVNSKTPAGRRCLPTQYLLPTSLQPLMVEMMQHAFNLTPGKDLFCLAETPRHQRRLEIIAPAIEVLRRAYGDGIDMYTLRHGFASWCYLRASKLLQQGGKVWNESEALSHAIFNEDLDKFAELVFYQRPGYQDSEVFYRLCRLMGHATPSTLPKTYIHSAGLVHSAFLSQHFK